MTPHSFTQVAQQLIDVGRMVDGRGWVPATSGNLSARLPDGTVAITVSGKHKGRLRLADIMVVDGRGQSLDGRQPSAEILLHTALYRRFPAAQAVLHPHPLRSVLVSRLFGGQIVLQGYELLKAFVGVASHEARLVVPIFANDQDIARLARVVDAYLDGHDNCHAYVIAGHGLYTWADSVWRAFSYLEALDYLFAAELQLHGVKHEPIGGF